MNMITQNQISQAIDRLIKKFDPQKIILFGSHARGITHDKSDVDLFIISPFEGKRRKVLVEMDRSLLGIGFALDLILLTPDEFERDHEIPGTIARPAAREGKILYERV